MCTHSLKKCWGPGSSRWTRPSCHKCIFIVRWFLCEQFNYLLEQWNSHNSKTCPAYPFLTWLTWWNSRHLFQTNLFLKSNYQRTWHFATILALCCQDIRQPSPKMPFILCDWYICLELLSGRYTTPCQKAEFLFLKKDIWSHGEEKRMKIRWYAGSKKLNAFVTDLHGLGNKEIIRLYMSVLCWSVLCFFWDTDEKLSSKVCLKLIFYFWYCLCPWVVIPKAPKFCNHLPKHYIAP